MSELVARTVFEYLGVTGEYLERLVLIAELSRKRSNGPAVAAPDWFEQLLVLERDASMITEVALTIPPGLVQTERLARAIFAVGGGDQADEYVAARMERQKILDNRNLEYWLLIHEAALRRVIGGPKVMREQVEHLINLSRQPNLRIRIIPNEVGAHRSMLTSFMLLEFGIFPNYKLAYTEHVGGGLYVDDPPGVKEFDNASLHIRDVALPAGQSRTLLTKIAQDYK